MLDRIGRKQDGVVSGANTANRKRMVFGKAMDYACEIGAMPSSPLKRIKWTKPRTLRAVPGRGHQQHQARQFLAAVGRQGLDRLLELLLIVVLRAWFARPGNGAPGWYRTYSDPVVGQALRLLHHNPAHPWTVAKLARATSASRASLARRFSDLVGEPPMAFLTGWRIALAADLLRKPEPPSARWPPRSATAAPSR